MAQSTKPRLRRPPNKLTAKALRFAHEYAVDLNATKAAREPVTANGAPTRPPTGC